MFSGYMMLYQLKSRNTTYKIIAKCAGEWAVSRYSVGDEHITRQSTELN